MIRNIESMEKINHSMNSVNSGLGATRKKDLRSNSSTKGSKVTRRVEVKSDTTFPHGLGKFFFN